MRQTWDEYFMELAYAAAKRATCPRRYVGCILVDKDNNVVATGYNGAPPGEPHCRDVGCLMVDNHCKRTIHAEANAISRSSWWKRRGGRAYCTTIPCLDCAKLLTKSGIAEVIYYEGYPKWEPIVYELFHENSIVVRPLEIPDGEAVYSR